MTSIRRSRALVGMAMTGLLALTGCSLGSSNSPSSSGDITVALMDILSGPHADVGERQIHGSQVGIYEVNHNGGVMGRQLVPQVGDTAGDPVDAVTTFRQLNTYNPAFELGPASFEIEGVIKSYDTLHLPEFNNAGTTALDQQPYKYVWRTVPSDSALTAGMSYYALEHHLMHAALFFLNTSNSYTEIPPLQKFYTAHGGQVTDSEVLVPHQTSYNSEIQKAFNTNPDVVFFNLDPGSAATLFSNMKQLGDLNGKTQFVGDNNGADPQVMKGMGFDIASKISVGFTGQNPAGPSFSHFADDYHAVWGPNIQIYDSTENTYDGIVIAALAMTDAKSADPTVWNFKIKDVTTNESGKECYTYPSCVSLLNAGTKIDFEGAAGPEDFDQYNNTYGGWTVVQFDTSGQPHSLETITADQVQKEELPA